MAKKAVAKKSSAKKDSVRLADYSVLIEPVITEKATGGGELAAFFVDPRCSKTEIKAAVERIFKVEVAKVRTCRYIGKLKRTTRTVGRRAAFKKAYVTCKPGHTINVVEGL